MSIQSQSLFGSCPTFYINETDNFHYADAEGFSNAISPSMEYFDIDALNNQKVSGDEFSIMMKNEALETHCINDVKLFAYPLEKGERVYQSPSNDFFLCENEYSLSQANAEEGITTLLKSNERIERFSLSDENNLISKEEVYLTYDQVAHTDSLWTHFKFPPTLLTTYLIYSAMGYIGDEVDIFAKIETGEGTSDKT